MTKNQQINLQMKSNQTKNNPMEWNLYLEGMLNSYKILKGFAILVTNQNVLFFVLEFVEDPITKSVMKKY